MRILADGSLPFLNLFFTAPLFELTTYDTRHTACDQIFEDALQNYEVLLCRSTFKINEYSKYTLPSKLKTIATASSGTDHLHIAPILSLELDIMDAKGANAHAVVDYVLSVFAILKIKTCFKIGIIGMGQVGTMLHQLLLKLGFEVVGYDPPKAKLDAKFKSCEFKELTEVDVLCIHANLHHEQAYPSANLVDGVFLNAFKKDVIIINAARGGIVDESALIHFNQSIQYCTDVYCDEPNISREIIHHSRLCTPHIAGHSIEAKFRAIQKIYEQICLRFNLPTSIQLVPLKANQTPSPKNVQGILNHYDPSNETNALKSSKNVAGAFKAMRKAHCFRHELNWDQLSWDQVG